ncbi:MAG: hydantoinase/oxoprolinase family protein [Methylococcaceae bacterium]
MKQTYSIGWDIGGAHIKAAVLDQAGVVSTIFLLPCPLWKGIEQLRKAVTDIMKALPAAQYRHAITMTGELVDCFEHREDGVKQILAAMSELLFSDELHVFAGEASLLNAKDVKEEHYQAIASANWLVSATFVAQKVGNGLFIDIGSTTTDILLLDNGEVRAQGYTDYQRLISQELIYTGIIRTAVMAVAQTALDNDNEIGIMAEYFATMADVYRVTGELNESHDHTETADGAEKTLIASARRLSRMIGCDFNPDELPRWQTFAKNIRAQQLIKIQSGCERHISNSHLSGSCPLIGAGVGRFLVKQLALNLGHPYLDFSDLFPISPSTGITTADCAPAVAVACLAKCKLPDYRVFA